MSEIDGHSSSHPETTYLKVDRQILGSARIPFLIALAALLLIAFVYASQTVLKVGPTFVIHQDDSAFVRFILSNAIYVLLSSIAFFSCYIAYRLVVAAGATRNLVIPPEDYALISPLVADGKSESIDQYVRLSSLTRFTGTFTQLGLTGLPLATIFLTLVFSVIAIFNESFLDLTKLTLGAFIGSFVQRQVERRADTGNQTMRERLTEAASPRDSA